MLLRHLHRFAPCTARDRQRRSRLSRGPFIGDGHAKLPTGSSFDGSSSDTFGWAAGVSLEWMFAPNWSFKAEYLHVDLGSSNVNVANPAISLTESVDYRFHRAFDSARIGVNYHFDGPIVAKY